MASSASPPPPSPPSPPSAAKKSFLRRILPLLLTANLAVGVYILTRTNKEQSADKEEEATLEVPSAPAARREAADHEKAVSTKSLPPVTEDEKRQLLKWILEEKRKVKPSDPLEKKKIDEEKALLKQYIWAKSMPSFAVFGREEESKA